jgi:hypothetical protein
MLYKILGIIALFLLMPMSALSQSWQNLQPGTTTEAEFLRRFRTPEHVVIRFIGYDAFNYWRKTKYFPTYDFEYFMHYRDKNNEIYDGPLGESQKVVVKFTRDKKLWEVVWTYVEGFRLHSRTAEKPTRITIDQIERLFGSNTFIMKRFGDKETPHAALYRFKKVGFVIDVTYLNEVSDIESTLSREGTVIIE